MPVALLVNSKSRRGEDCFEQALAWFKKHKIELNPALHSRDMSVLIEAAKKAVANKVSYIAVGGGDGTVGALSAVIAGSETTMAVLPLGTGNSFARDLGIPTELEGAFEVALNGKQVEVGLGCVGDKTFVNVATVGLSTKIAQNLTDPMKKKFGRFVYVVAVVRAYRDIRPFRAVLETENGRQEFDTLQVVIGNGRLHAGPFPVMPDASLLKPVLSVYAIETRSKAELLKFALFLPGGRHVQLSEVHSEHCKRGKLTTSPSVRVTVDGEVGPNTPFDFCALDKPLRVKADPNYLEKTGSLPREHG